MSDLKAALSRRPTLSALSLNALVATWFLALANATFWGHIFRIFEGRTVTALVFAAAIWLLLLLVITLLAVGRLQKPVLAALLILGAVASYYVDVLGVVIDREMVQNAMTTTFAESRHLITRHFIGHVALYGVLPAGMVLWPHIRRRTFWRGFGAWAVVTSATAALMVGFLFTNLKAYSTVLRADKELLGSVQPLAPLAASLRYGKMMLRSTEVVLHPTGTDVARRLCARDEPRTCPTRHPVLSGRHELRHCDCNLASLHVLAPYPG
jgi:lipid A ethanolaminephosphotransferase